MRDLMPALFYLATGAGFLLFLATWFLARNAMRALAGRLFAFALLCVPVGFMLLANAAQASSLGAASNLLVGAGAAFFVGAALVCAGLIVTARNQGTSAP